MKTKKTLFVAGLGFAVLLIALPMAFARGGGGPGERGERGYRFDRMAEKLGLDAKQKVTLKTLHEQHRDEADSLRDQMKAAQEKVKAAWLDKNADAAKIRAAHREVHALKGQLAEQRVEFGLAVKKVLTPEQFETFAERFLDGPGFGRHGKFGKGGKRGKYGGEGWGGQRGGPRDGSGPGRGGFGPDGE